MKKLALSLFAFTIAIFVVAQEKPKIKEVGIVFSNLDNFGLSFKIGNEKALWRINTLLIDGGNWEETMDSAVSKTSSIGFSFGVGREYRKTIAKNLELRYGADLSFGYHKNKLDFNYNDEHTRLSTRTFYGPRFNLVFGFNYVIKEKLIIGAEILPYFSYTFGSRVDEFSENDKRETDISRIDYGLSNTSIMLSIGYRF
jgi:hypothetical protein